MDVKTFNELIRLCQQVGYFGLSPSETYQPNSQTLKMLAATLRRGLALAEKNHGAPYETFRRPEARKQVEQVIGLCEKNLGLVFKTMRRVDRPNDERATARELKPLPLAVAGAVFRTRPDVESR
jgi:hypothetical protein